MAVGDEHQAKLKLVRQQSAETILAPRRAPSERNAAQTSTSAVSGNNIGTAASTNNHGELSVIVSESTALHGHSHMITMQIGPYFGQATAVDSENADAVSWKSPTTPIEFTSLS